MKRRRLIAGMALITVLLFPAFDRLTAFQPQLWTSADTDAGDDWLYTNGITVTDIREWQRVRFGLPLRAVTMDRQPAAGTLQLRIEWWALTGNAAAFTAASGFLLLLRLLWRQHKTHPHPDTF